MENFLLVARQVAVLFALIGVGAACRRTKLLNVESVRGIVNVLLLLVTPSLIVECFQRPLDRGMLGQLGLAFVIAASLHALLIAAAARLFRGDDAESPVLRLAAVFSNAGFMGIPLEQAVLGREGVFYGVVYIAVFNLLIWSWGFATMSGRGAGRDLCRTFVNPGTVGVALGLPLFLFSVTLPDVAREPVRMLAGLNTPLAMLVIGFYLAGSNPLAAFRSPRALAASALRLAGAPLALLGVFWLLRGRLDRTMMLALVIGASAPVAAMVTMFSARFNRDIDLAVGLVSGTTLASVATMPTVVALAMNLL